MAENPTPEEIMQVAKSGNTGAVKTLSDIRYDQLAAKVAELEAAQAKIIKENAELRAANAELYSFAAQVSQPAASSAATAAPQVNSHVSQPVAAAPMAPAQDEAAIRAREEEQLQNVLVQMGYRKLSQSVNDTSNDGM